MYKLKSNGFKAFTNYLTSKAITTSTRLIKLIPLLFNGWQYYNHTVTLCGLSWECVRHLVVEDKIKL